MDQALGLIETRGLVAAIEAADAMVKAADVKIISKEKVTGALIIIKVSGETSAVKAAVDAGAVAAQRVGELISAHIIPRPDDQIDQLLYDLSLTSENEIEKEAKVEETKPGNKSVTVKEVSSKLPERKTEIKKGTTSVTQKVKKEEEPKLKPKIKIEEKKTEKIKPSSSSHEIPSLSELEILNVHSLRKIARSFEEFPIKGREISKANRGKLLDYFRTLQK